MGEEVNDQVKSDEIIDIKDGEKPVDKPIVNDDGSVKKEEVKKVEVNWEGKYKEFESGITPKLQRLSELEKEVPKFKTYSELDKWLTANPDKAEKFIAYVQKLKENKDIEENEDDLDPSEKRYRDLEARTAKAEKILYDQSVEREQVALKQELSDLKAKYKHINEKYLLERAMNNPTESLEPIAKEYNEMIEGIIKSNTVNKEEIIKEYVNGKIKESKSTIEGKGGTPPGQPSKSLDLKDAKKEAIELMKAYDK